MFHPSTTALAAPALTRIADSSPLVLIRPLDELLGVGIPAPDYAAVEFQPRLMTQTLWDTRDQTSQDRCGAPGWRLEGR
jgi:hypothetical protein